VLRALAITAARFASLHLPPAGVFFAASPPRVPRMHAGAPQ
jgi:hypothetical protein